MVPLTIQQLFSGNFVPALCRTFAHSLWQGLLLAIIVAIVMVATRRSAAAVRYNLLVGSLLLFITGIILTFCIQLNASSGGQHLINEITIDQSSKNILPTTLTNTQDPVNISVAIIAFVNKYADIIALAWLLIFLFKAMRLAAGLYSIHRIRQSQTSGAGDHWNERLQVLSNKLRVSRPVQLLQSGIATVPVVLGYFKPVILFPAALLASLPAAEVEAVLVHELAHVRRGDYLVNLLQQLVEVFFFFNPALLWVSSLIRTERENCCDDIVLDQTSNNKINYINALIAFQEYRLTLPQYAPALMGRKDHLLLRVKRIIYNNNKTLNAMEKIFLTSGIIVAGVLALAFSPGKSASNLQTTVAASPARSTTAKMPSILLMQKDTVPLPLNKLATTGMSNINSLVDGKRYDLQLNNDLITALTIDGQKVDDSKIADYKTITDSIIRQAKENMMREKLSAEKASLMAENGKTDAERSKVLAEKMGTISELAKLKDENTLLRLQELNEVNVQQSKIKEEQTLSLLGQLKGNLALKQSKELETRALLENLKIKLSTLDANSSKGLSEKLQSLTLADSKNQLRLAQLESELSLKDASISLIDAKVSRKLNQELMASAELKMKKDKQLQLIDQTSSARIIDDLVREKLVKDGKNLSFTLNNNELIVNGVKQPDPIFRKFKEKYVKTEDWNMNYNNKE